MKTHQTHGEAPFLHARVTVELPFQLALPSGLYPLKLPFSNAALVILVKSAASWVLGYTADPTSPTVLRQPRHFGMTSTSDGLTMEIADWVRQAGLEKAVILPASTILEIWIGFAGNDFPKEVVVWAEANQTRRLILFLINNFLSRYQVACGFTPPAGHVGPVSELELRHLSVQLFSGDSPRSASYAVVPALPTQPAQTSLNLPPDASSKLNATLHAPAMPLWLELAHDAHSLLYRGRHEQSIMGWVQSLEVAVGQFEEHLEVKSNKKATVEERLAEILNQRGMRPLDMGLRAKLVTARQLRNKIVHEGKRLPFDDTQAEDVAKAVTHALALIQNLAVRLQATQTS